MAGGPWHEGWHQKAKMYRNSWTQLRLLDDERQTISKRSCRMPGIHVPRGLGRALRSEVGGRGSAHNSKVREWRRATCTCNRAARPFELNLSQRGVKVNF